MRCVSLIALLSAGCSAGQSVALVTVGGNAAHVGSFVLTVTLNGRSSQPVMIVPAHAPVDLPPPVRLALGFPPDAQGTAMVHVEARSTDGDIATGDSAPFALTPSEEIDVAVMLGGPPPPDAGVDLQSPDLAQPDLAQPDLAQPDCDIAQPDLATPDLATRDQGNADISSPPDLAVPPDLASPPDLALSSPLAITGLKLWIAADTIAGLADGQPVGLWPDRSGNGFDLVGTGPTYSAVAVNGKPAVHFENQRLLSQQDSGLTGDVAVSVFVVARVPETAPLLHSNYPFAIGTGACGGQSLAIVLDWRTDDFQFTAQCNGSMTWSPNGALAPYFNRFALLEVAKMPGAPASLYVDGVALTVSANGSFVSVDNAPFEIGGSDVIGDSDFTGDMAELLVYGRALTATERTQVEGYLKGEYALP